MHITLSYVTGRAVVMENIPLLYLLRVVFVLSRTWDWRSWCSIFIDISLSWLTSSSWSLSWLFDFYPIPLLPFFFLFFFSPSFLLVSDTMTIISLIIIIVLSPSPPPPSSPPQYHHHPASVIQLCHAVIYIPGMFLCFSFLISKVKSFGVESLVAVHNVGDAHVITSS